MVLRGYVNPRPIPCSRRSGNDPSLHAHCFVTLWQQRLVRAVNSGMHPPAWFLRTSRLGTNPRG